MSGAAAANTLLQIQVAAAEAKGEVLSEKAKKAMFDQIKARYDEQLSPYYAAARLWVDAVIDPLDTRKVLAEGAGGGQPRAGGAGVQRGGDSGVRE
ncbi:hypothetical protein MRB53_041956 [Persea americana]|nr:hypothetical protein MRB53_041956 [Persea americana]